MNVLIVSFSQTGNTGQIARAICDGITGGGDRCDRVMMKHAGPGCAGGYDLIGIGCPTFYYREPRNVSDFMQGMDRVDGKHCFVFCTHGSVMGNTLSRMSAALQARGYTVIGAFDSYANSTVQFYPRVMHTHGHPDPADEAAARKFGEDICGLSRRIRNGEQGLIPSYKIIEGTWWANDSKAITPDLLRKISPRLVINPEKCTGCLECEENCPVDAIEIRHEPPLIQKEGCIFCWYCEKSCPAGAIEADWTVMRKGSQGNLQKYISELAEAERHGKFRPHVDYEKIKGSA